MTKHDAERKVRILDFIAATLRARGYPPSVREIATAVGLASTSAVHHHLQILERDGYLERGAAQSRAIRLTPTAAIRLGLSSELVPQATTPDSFVVPIIGEIAAGGPIEAYQDASESMSVPDMLAPSGDAYVLRVRGDSMIEAHITDGDFVLIRPQSTARNGDIVVAQVEENAVTLKRFFKEKDKIRLQPANQAYPPQFYDDVRIQGKLIGVITKAGLRAGGRTAQPRVGALRAFAHARRVRSLSCSRAAFVSNGPAARFSVRTAASSHLARPRTSDQSLRRRRSGDIHEFVHIWSTSTGFTWTRRLCRLTFVDLIPSPPTDDDAPNPSRRRPAVP